MKPPRDKPSLIVKKEGYLSLSGFGLAKLMKGVLEKGVPFRFKAKGFSMTPFIRDGDVVTIAPILGSGPALGDIVAFVRPKTERLTVHRIIRKKAGFYWVKADNISDVDGLISKLGLLGRVVRVERNGKRVFLGVGPERLLIAMLSRAKFVFPWLLSVWRTFRSILGRRMI